MCKISFIVPVYNAQKTLRRCVESLVYGDEKDIEIILIEDRSDDNSWKLCLELQQEFSQIHCIQNAKNSGVSHTRNRGLEAATGEYIVFVDSDDWASYEYATKLLSVARVYPDALVVCGYRFRDQAAGYDRDYVWQESGEEQYILNKRDFFPLMGKVLMQSLWNKIFYREVIERAQIRFDETQSMGEDFEFVLGYMKLLSCERCVVINEPLYCYVRAGASSLMSNFGLIENNDEYARLLKLRDIAGKEDLFVQKQYESAVAALRDNYAYHVVHSTKLNRKQKLTLIEKLVGSERAHAAYRRHYAIVRKEQATQAIAKAKLLERRLKAKIQRLKNRRLIIKQKKALANDRFTLLSQNCIGGVFYHDMGLPFQSPTINLYFTAADFVKLAKEPRRYMELSLEVKWGLDYPLGKLGDIMIHFMHYKTCEEAKAAWERRKARVDYDNIVIISTDMEGFDDSVFEQWKAIPYPKALFTANPKYANDPGSVYYPQYQGYVVDLIPKREFYKDGTLVIRVNKV